MAEATRLWNRVALGLRRSSTTETAEVSAPRSSPTSEAEDSTPRISPTPDAGAATATPPPPAPTPDAVAPTPRSVPTPEQPPDSAQVSRAFEDLMARYQRLLQQGQQAPTDAPASAPQAQGTAGVPALSRQIIEDAQKEADSLKMRARQEAEVEAGRIVTEAKREAQDTLSRAQRDAQNSTEREVANILQSAQKRAQINEDRAKQVAQLFLVSARDDIQDHVTGDAKNAYYKLLSSLQDVMTAAQDVETEWKNRTAALWDSTAFRLDELNLEEYHSALVGSLAAGTLEAPPEERGALSREEDLAAARSSEPEPTGDAEEEAALVAEFVAQGEDTTESPAAEVAAEADSTEGPAAGAAIIDADDEVSTEGVLPTATTEVEEITSEQPVVAFETELEEETRTNSTIPHDLSGFGVDEDTGSGDHLPSTALGEQLHVPPEEPQDVDATDERESLPISPTEDNGSAAQEAGAEGSKVYMGEVELEIVPFADMARIVEFHGLLNGIEGVTVQSTAGSWDRGTTITVMLDRPLSLGDTLSQMPNVKATPAVPEKSNLLQTTLGTDPSQSRVLTSPSSIVNPATWEWTTAPTATTRDN